MIPTPEAMRRAVGLLRVQPLTTEGQYLLLRRMQQECPVVPWGRLVPAMTSGPWAGYTPDEWDYAVQAVVNGADDATVQRHIDAAMAAEMSQPATCICGLPTTQMTDAERARGTCDRCADHLASCAGRFCSHVSHRLPLEGPGR